MYDALARFITGKANFLALKSQQQRPILFASVHDGRPRWWGAGGWGCYGRSYGPIPRPGEHEPLASHLVAHYILDQMLSDTDRLSDMYCTAEMLSGFIASTGMWQCCELWVSLCLLCAGAVVCGCVHRP